MKIRLGFVSNSSSSSFVTFGYKIKKSADIIKKIINNLGKGKWENFLDENKKTQEQFDSLDQREQIELYDLYFYSVLNVPIKIYYDDYSGYCDEEDTFIIGCESQCRLDDINIGKIVYNLTNPEEKHREAFKCLEQGLDGITKEQVIFTGETWEP
jgi:hypothetical protein